MLVVGARDAVGGDADLVVLARRDDEPVLAAVFEAQLSVDSDKLFSWPVYATVARSRHRCPAIVVVLCLDQSVASWAAQPIDVGEGSVFRCVVVGPESAHAVRGQRYYDLICLFLSDAARSAMENAMSKVDLTEADLSQFESRAMRHWMDKGRQEGRRQALLEAAIRMSAKGMEPPQIAEILGTSVDELQALLAQPPSS